ncbi:hypothetical protein B0A55_02996 [Friedmanniomyces simplex]|uniref:Zn(2)-C6 fungal-type domain-containing protein n=1 Tax=Friedmanniomyces simplex TaxID=329884 RepID=A0A4U0XXH2_9PEZI|nr:hypothetical protein B0A55_02996 [Friedmanniomyces simplex]
MSALAAAANNDKHTTHGAPMTRIDTGSSGFTAVNGNSHKVGYIEPNEKSTALGTQTDCNTEASKLSLNSQYRSHGWRPDVQGTIPPQQEAPDARKRKRSGSGGVDIPGVGGVGQPRVDNAHSPKRRIRFIDSAVDLTSPETAVPPLPLTIPQSYRASIPAQIGLSSREPSPVRRLKGADPVPPPRPEIEATLAELKLKPKLEIEHKPKPMTKPWQRRLGHRRKLNLERKLRQLMLELPEQEGGEYDPKKRKRNFSNRTKTGCHTCRRRKKKCDEAKPHCTNCERGGFACEGYGPKAPGTKEPTTMTRLPVTLQSKAAYEPTHGPATYFQTPSEEGRSYSHWGEHLRSEPQSYHAPEHHILDQQPIHPAEYWPRPPARPPAEPPLGYAPERLPPYGFAEIPPLRSHAPGYPPPPPLGPWGGDHSAPTPIRPPIGPGAMMSSRVSATTNGSHLSALSHNSASNLTEKDKMLLGRPFRAYHDSELITDREQCRAALERYNDAARAASGISTEEKGRFFKAVIEPPFRPGWRERHPHDVYTGPKGYVGHSTLIDTPFTCDYGYNIHLADSVLIQPGCYMQDACEIHVGARTIIGPNVKFYGVTASVDKNKRQGSEGTFVAGAITVGEDCFIGGDVIILPFRRIGSGAVVGAGSVVTKDVKENTVVAGNPAKVIRRINPGPNVDQHHPEIQDQNDTMLGEMVETARRGHDR